MSATKKHFLGGVALCAGVTLSALSVAWACSPGGGISVNPSSGTAGSTALVSGSGYESVQAGAGPVEIRWNSMSGPVMATASGPSFSASVTIPASAGERVKDRTYYIVAVQQLSGGGTRTASAPFTVPATEPQPQPEAQPQPQPEAQPQPVARQDPAPAPVAADAAPAPSAAPAAPVAAKAPTSAATAGRPSSRMAPAATRTAPARAGSTAPAGSGATAPVAETPEPVATPAAEPAGEVAELPSGRTVSSDVWSGFSEGTTSRGPSLVEPTSSTNGSGDAGLGLGLVALGTVGLLGGTVAGLRARRRPVAVEASTEAE